MPQIDPNARFGRCFDFVCSAAVEGGFVNDPADPGGATNHGITIATLSHWRGRACTVDDIKALTFDEARTIYRAQYWAAVSGDALPAGVDLMVFDSAVNQGPGTAARFLQAAVHAKPDGHIGPATIAAVAAADPVAVVAAIAAARRADYRGDAGFERFGHGWLARVDRTLGQAEAWATAA